MINGSSVHSILPRDLIPQEDQWCVLSEQRLFNLLIEHKPAGSLKYLEIIIISFRLNFIGDDESIEDIKTFASDPLVPSTSDLAKAVMHFYDFQNVKLYEPKYEIRPSIAKIWEKISLLYDLKAINRMEGLSENFTDEADFFLPEGSYSELIKKKEDEKTRDISNPAQQQFINTSSSTPSISKAIKTKATRQSTRKQSGLEN